MFPQTKIVNSLELSFHQDTVNVTPLSYTYSFVFCFTTILLDLRLLLK